MAKTLAEIREALTETRGNVSAAARHLGLARNSLAERIAKNQGLKDLTASLREERVDRAESGLDTALDNGEAWAISLTLRTIGKDRGYIERAEQETTGEMVIRIVDDE